MKAKPQSCVGCACYDMGTDFSRVEGTGVSGIMLVGEASGEHEQREGTPFVKWAPAGSLLERIFRRMGLDRQQFSITNVVRCRPRNNWLEKSPWEYSAINHCRPNLDAAIAERRPRVIVALGGVATRELTGLAGTALGVTHLAGYVLPGPNRIPVVPDFHPAYLRRGKASHQGLFARILNRARAIAAGTDRAWMWDIDPENQETCRALNYLTAPSLSDVESYAQYVLGNSGATVSYDIETDESASLDEDAREGFADTRIRLVQFAVDGRGAIAVPWERQFAGPVTSILHSANLKVGHNVWAFDNKVLRAAGEREGLDLRPRGTIHDTLAMFHHWQPDLPAHLQAAAQYVQFPFPWKHMADTDMPFYGCCDVDATLRLYNFLRPALMKEGLWDDGVAA